MGRDRVIKSFAEVLACTAARPGTEFAKELATETEQLQERVERFYREFCRLSPWRQLTPAALDLRFDSLLAAYSELSDLLRRLKVLLRSDGGYGMGEKGYLINEGRLLLQTTLSNSTRVAV